MNIRNRIKKLENQTVNNSAEFCDCFDIHFRKMVDQVYNGTPYDETGASLPDGDYCDKCRKPVAERNFDQIDKINKIYGDVAISELIYEH